MTLPPNIQDVVNEARDAYFHSVIAADDKEAQERWAKLHTQVARLLDMTYDQAFELIAVGEQRGY